MQKFGCNKLLVLKLNSLWKHVGQRKVTTLIANVVIAREYQFLKTNQNVINDHFYVSNGKDFLV